MTAPLKAGRYQLLEELGRGAMGVVYRAQDPVIGRMVAVKTVRLSEQGTGMSHEELLTRFQTEARAAGQLAHPNIVVVHDAGEDDGLFYITMELVEGRSLQALLEARTAFPLARIMRIMQQACSALDFAHQHKVVHRDIKPANLMLTADDTLKITDFGTAKILQYGTSHTALAIGTPSYMSPEQIKGRPVDGRSDVFSLGVVFYEMLTGEKPFAGESVTTVIYKIVNEDPVPPRELDSSIPPGLSEIVARALNKSPEARLQNCREFWRMLQNYRDFAGTSLPAASLPRATPGIVQIPATAAKLSQVTGTGAAQGPPTLTPEAAARYLSSTPPANMPPERSRRGSSAWIALLLLVVIAGAGYRVWPALLEVWQRSRTTQTAQVQPAVKPAAEATPQSTPETTLGPTSSSAAPSSQLPANSDASAEPSPSEAQPSTKPDQASVSQQRGGGGSEGHRAASVSSDPPAPKEVKQSAPTLDSAQPAALTTRVGNGPAATKPGASPTGASGGATVVPQTGPQVSPAAARWKRSIEATLVATDASDKVHVAASGNTLRLTGNLSTGAHEKLLNWLGSNPNPTRVQIIDDIEFEEAPSQ